jgi:hypothetical protein
MNPMFWILKQNTDSKAPHDFRGLQILDIPISERDGTVHFQNFSNLWRTELHHHKSSDSIPYRLSL